MAMAHAPSGHEFIWHRSIGMELAPPASFKRTTQIVIYRMVNLIPSDLVKLPIFVLIMIALAAPAAPNQAARYPFEGG